MEKQFELPVALIIWIAVAVVGNIEVIKRLPKEKHLPTWLWALLSVLLCCGYGAAAQFVGHWVVYIGVAIAFVKLGYAIIVKGVIAFVGQVVSNLGKPPASPNNPTQGQVG